MKGARKGGAGSNGMLPGELQLTLQRVKAKDVTTTSVVLDEAMEAEEVIRAKKASKYSGKAQREQHKYQSDVWETVDEDNEEEEQHPGGGGRGGGGGGGGSSSSSSSSEKGGSGKKSSSSSSSSSASKAARVEPQPAWLKSQGNAGEARIVYASDKAGGAGVDAEEVAAKEARMDSSIRSRFQSLVGSITGKRSELQQAQAAEEEERKQRQANLAEFEAGTMHASCAMHACIHSFIHISS